MRFAALAVFVAAVGQAQGGAADFFTEAEKNFGPSPVGPVLVHNFTITNKSAVPVTMGAPRIGCGCVSATLVTPNLAPGQSTFLIAHMDTKKIPQQQKNMTKTVTVTVPFLTPVAEDVTVKVTTFARDDLFFSPHSLAFGTVTKGTEAKASMKVTLYTGGKFQITKAESNGRFVTAEVKESSRTAGEVTYEVVAKLDKDCFEGNWTSEVFLTTNAAGLEKIRVPVSVKVNSTIAASPAELKFGDVSVNAETPSVQLLLQGDKPFKVLEFKGVDGDVTVKPITEGSRATHIIKVNVKAHEAGALLQKLQIVTDSTDMPTVIVPVSATAKK